MPVLYSGQANSILGDAAFYDLKVYFDKICKRRVCLYSVEDLAVSILPLNSKSVVILILKSPLSANKIFPLHTDVARGRCQRPAARQHQSNRGRLTRDNTERRYFDYKFYTSLDRWLFAPPAVGPT